MKRFSQVTIRTLSQIVRNELSAVFLMLTAFLWTMVPLAAQLQDLGPKIRNDTNKTDSSTLDSSSSIANPALVSDPDLANSEVAKQVVDPPVGEPAGAAIRDEQEVTSVDEIKTPPQKPNAALQVDQTVGEEDEVCRPVIKVFTRRRDNSAVESLRRDIEQGRFDEVAVDIQVGTRIRDQPKIMVPINPDRYRVWYGYHSGIRDAVLRTAAEFSKSLPSDDSQENKDRTAEASEDSNKSESTESADSSLSEASDQGVRETGYPTRKSWWTVDKRHPEKDGMVKHLSGGPHKGKFDLAWLETLTRDELHSLHSDDHEGKVDWDYAVKQKTVSVEPDDGTAEPDMPVEDLHESDSELNALKREGRQSRLVLLVA